MGVGVGCVCVCGGGWGVGMCVGVWDDVVLLEWAVFMDMCVFRVLCFAVCVGGGGGGGSRVCEGGWLWGCHECVRV